VSAPPTIPSGMPAGAESVGEEKPASLFGNRNFLLLWQGQAVSQLGNQAFGIAMGFWVLEATGSASLMGLLMATLNLPVVFLAPIGGALADRLSRIKILIACDSIAGLAMLVQSFAMLSGRCSRPVQVALFFGVALTIGVVNSFFMPALGACIPDLVPAARLTAANSLNQFSVRTAMLIGQSVGGVLYHLIGAARLFLFDGVTFLFCAASESLVRLPPRPAGERLGFAASIRKFLGSIREGFAYVRRTPGMLNFILCPVAFNFFTMPVMAMLPFFVRYSLHAGAAWYGFLIAAISTGSLAGFLMAGTLRLAGAARGRFVMALLGVAPVPMAVAGFLHLPVAALAAAFVIGIMIGMINVNILTLLQTSTPREMRGRVMGLWTSLVTGLMPVGMAVGGIAGDLTGKNIPLIFSTCSALTLAIICAALSRRSTRQFLAQA
jgi:DHA3 family macrolide efflux protein-like MFS transporter